MDWLQSYLNQKIWFTRVDSFNDKFEGISIEKRVSGKEIVESPVLFDIYYRHSKELNPDLTPEEFKKELSSTNAKELVGKSYVKNYLQSHGVLCLTLDDSNIPMWAHYANNCQGYCVIFELDFDWVCKKDNDFSKLPDEKFEQYIDGIIREDNKENQEMLSFYSSLDRDMRFVFTKVLYQNKFPEIKETDLLKIIDEYKKTGNNYEQIKYIIQNTIGVKFEKWKYEEEYRLIVNTNSILAGLMDLRRYPFLKVTGIIMGEEIGKNIDQDVSNFLKTLVLDEKNIPCDDLQEKLKNFIYAQASSRNIQVFIAKKSANSYKIDKEDYSPNKQHHFGQVMDNQVMNPSIDVRTTNTSVE